MVAEHDSRTSSHGGGGGAGPSQNAHVRSHWPAIMPFGAKSAAQVMPAAIRLEQPWRMSSHGASPTAVSPTPLSSSPVHIPAACISANAASAVGAPMPTHDW